jgi:DNA-binding NtrC family response regulator
LGDILIVDDEADIRDLVAGILQDEGYSTRTARDSDSRWRRSRRGGPTSGLSRHLAARQQARRFAIARQIKQNIPTCRS